MKFKCAMLDGEALCNIVQFRIAQSSAHTDTHQCNAVQSNAVQSSAVQCTPQGAVQLLVNNVCKTSDLELQLHRPV